MSEYYPLVPSDHPELPFPAGWQLCVSDSIGEMAGCWHSLQRTCSPYVFQTYEWISAWQTQLGVKQGWTPWIVTLQDAHGQTVMLFALGMTTQRAGRVLGFLGGEVTDYSAPLVAPSCLAYLNQPVFNALWRKIVALLPVVDVVSFKRMPARLEDSLNPMVWIDGMQATEQAHAASLTATYDAFQSERSAKMFADTRRQWRRLCETGDARLLVQVDAADKAAVIAALARQKSRRWQETGSRDLFAEPGYLDFYTQLANAGIAGGEVVVSGLAVDGQWIATHWGVRYGTRFYWLMPGYENERWARYSPGRVLLDAVVQWAITEKLTVFDLTVGDESYKRQWADTVLPLYAGMYGVSVRGKAWVALLTAYRRLYAAARDNTHLRNLVKRLRGAASK